MIQISSLPEFFKNIGNFTIVHLSQMFSLKRELYIYAVSKTRRPILICQKKILKKANNGMAFLPLNVSGFNKNQRDQKGHLLYYQTKHWQLVICKQDTPSHSKISIFCFTMIWSRALIYSRPGGIPVIPWGDCIHCPPGKHNVQSTTN